jgi:hypothetical protein
MIGIDTVKIRLDENKIPYEVIELCENVNLVVCQYGGRILGPFIGDNPSICWINPVFESKEGFRQFIINRSWNIGGERIWLSPELDYNVPDPIDFWGSYLVPTNLDPGNYKLNRNRSGSVTLTQEMTLRVYGQESKEKSFYIERVITPLSNLTERMNDNNAVFFGYDHQVTLIDKRGNHFGEVWDLLQINPKGTMIIPTTAPVKYTEYYEPFEADYQTVFPKHVELKIDAIKRYKVGYKSLYTTGRSGYISKHCGCDYLMVRSFFNDICGSYLKSPASMPNERGHAIHIYNDDGRTGNFAEHECSAMPIGGASGRETSVDKFQTLFFMGSQEEILGIREILLGI